MMMFVSNEHDENYFKNNKTTHPHSPSMSKSVIHISLEIHCFPIMHLQNLHVTAVASIRIRH